MTDTITFKIRTDNGLKGYEAQLEDAQQKFAIKTIDCKTIAYRGRHPVSQEELAAPNRHSRRAAERKNRGIINQKISNKSRNQQ